MIQNIMMLTINDSKILMTQSITIPIIQRNRPGGIPTLMIPAVLIIVIAVIPIAVVDS